MTGVLYAFLLIIWWPILCFGFPRRGVNRALRSTESRILTISQWFWGLASFRLLADGDNVFVAVGGGYILSATIFFSLWRPRQLKRTFAELAKRRDMAPVPRAVLSGGHPDRRAISHNPIGRSYLSRTPEGMHVTVEPVVYARRGHKFVLYRLGIEIPGLPDDISLLPYPWKGSKPLPGEVRKLHPAFRLVSGSGASALALMCSAEVLDAVDHHIGERHPAGFRDEGPTLINRTIELTVPPDVGALERGLDELIELARLLDPQGKSVSDGLLDNLRHPNAEFQRLSFNALLTISSDVQSKLSTLELGLAHENDEIRITAAAHLPLEAYSELVGFVESGSPRHQARAMSVLRENYSWDQLEEVSRVALESANESLVTEAILACGKSADPELIPTVAAFLGDEPKLAAVAAQALKALGPSAESVLVQALTRTELEIIEAIVTTLGEIGGRDTVVALRQLASREDLPRRLSVLAQRTAEGISKDLEGEHGRLSLAECDVNDGRLSIADHEGALSFDVPQKNRAGEAKAREVMVMEDSPAEEQNVDRPAVERAMDDK